MVPEDNATTAPLELRQSLNAHIWSHPLTCIANPTQTYGLDGRAGLNLTPPPWRCARCLHAHVRSHPPTCLANPTHM
ncbi:hypothetical protein DUNSADRAFT_18246 [Dunaliella salina]|uniref:Encoded protein n=1 Tax=Dunaliella salina TaxID=3046 RepID=A0ABQ7GZD0_DUNSA|nr:hypothetical protein DUNSADRAFT_18246 [Dunaliella salina]|eukprot:KAF5839965.1 hypothetical protein DUNSADRAFT_18246 [Dunaliella salina]